MKRGEEIRNAIIECIRNYTKTHPYAPSVREIGDIVGLRSTSTVHRHLQILKERGILNNIGCSPRTISLTDEKETKAVEVTIEYEGVG